VTEKNVTKNILDGQTDGKQYTPLPLRGAGVYKFILKKKWKKTFFSNPRGITPERKKW
jgi:hypothetical protein